MGATCAATQQENDKAMVSINYATREVCCKIVYYGPGMSGKTTNLQVVHKKAPQNTRGKLISLATEADRTLYFDFLPINIGSINGFAAKFQLYTVPGQVYYNATRKLVLRGVDGIVFVADSQADKLDDNIESLSNLKENLIEYGFDINDLPIVIQYNKADLPSAMSQVELDAKLNTLGWPSLTATAVNGVGVFDTLKTIMKMVLEKAKTGGSRQAPPKQAAKVAVASEAAKAAELAKSAGTAGPSAPAVNQPSASPPVAAASVFGAARSPQQYGNKQVDPGYSAAATAEVPVTAPTSQAPGVPRPGSIFGTKRTSVSSPNVSSTPSAPDAQAQEKIQENMKSTAHSVSSTLADSNVQNVQQSQSAMRSMTQAAPQPTTEVLGHDPLEEPPIRSPKKRGFFSRLFGRK